MAMMKRLSDRFVSASIRVKIVALIATISFSVVILIETLLFGFEIRFLRESFENKYRSIARIVASNLEIPLLFSDISSENDVQDILSSLEIEKSIIQVVAFDGDGDLFDQKILREFDLGFEVSSLTSERLDSKLLIIQERIVSEAEDLGCVYVIASVEELKGLIFQKFIIFSIIAILISPVILFFSFKLGSILSAPMLELADSANKVAEGDFTVRHETDQKDEIGKLSDAFNQMVIHIEENQNELIRAKEAAESSNKAKDDFLSIMSHELRTPLNPILGLTDLIKAETDNEMHHEYLKTIGDSGKHLLELIDNILAYVQIDHNTPCEFCSYCSPLQIVNQCVEMFRDASNSKGLEIRVEQSFDDFFMSDEILVEVYVDCGKIGTVVKNLLSNAVKYTSKGSIRVRSKMIKTTDKTAAWNIEVIDTGMGIDESNLTKIFEPFSQSDESFTRSHGGIGLGLATCKRVIEKEGGELGVKPNQEGGSCFWFTLPVLFRKRKIENPVSAPAPSQRNTSGHKVLIVEDDANNLTVLESMLAKEGIPYRSAVNGKEAVMAALDEQFLFIIMDLSMPVMNGIDATKSIRESGNLVPIVGMSAHVGKDIEMKCLDAGMNVFVTKPCSRKDLQKLVQTWASVSSPG